MIDSKRFEGHTAGPWVFDDVSTYIGCREGMVSVLRTDAARSYDQFCPNGQLLAAAPDLLAEVIRLRAEVAALKGGAA